MKEVDTPGVSTVEKVSKFLKVKPEQLVKTLIYRVEEGPIAVLIRGDHELNEAKLKRAVGSAIVTMADEDTIKKLTGGPLGFSGPVGLGGARIIADFAIREMSDFVTGANKKDRHFINVNLDRDFSLREWADLRYISGKDPCPRCGKEIETKIAIELGHIFKLGTKYSAVLDCRYLDESGTQKDIIMGCYGIGVNRIAAAAIEQGHDENGIIWPKEIAPYRVVVIEVDPKDDQIAKESARVYDELTQAGIDALVDDRDERPGIKFKDADLIGIPIQVIIGKKNLKDGNIEVKIRKTGERTLHPAPEAVAAVTRSLI